MKKKQIKFLKRIVETPSPTGCEMRVADIVRERLGDIADEITTDTMGSVHACLYSSLKSNDDASPQGQGLDSLSPGSAGVKDTGKESSKSHGNEDACHSDAFLDSPEKRALTVMLAAHMDEIGLMVTYISDEGFLSIAAVGGVDAAILPGMRVDVHTRTKTLRGVVGRKPIHLIDPDDRKSVTPMDKLVIDLGMPAKQVNKLVRVGDQITIGVGFELFGDDMAVSRAFDDKVGVFIACRVMENLSKDPSYSGNFIAAITTQEEIGTRGAITSAHAINPDAAIVFDVTHATDYPGIDKSKYGNIVCGKGPVIARGPNINPVMFSALEQAALVEGVEFQLEAEPSVTGTDARSIQVSKDGVPTALVSIPLRYMHTPTEVINLHDVEDAIRLITRFVKNIGDVDCFVPGLSEWAKADASHVFGKCKSENKSENLGKKSQDASNGDSDVLNPEDAPFGRQHDNLVSGFRAYDINGFAGQSQNIAQQSDYHDASQQDVYHHEDECQNAFCHNSNTSHEPLGRDVDGFNAPSASAGFGVSGDSHDLDDPFEVDPYAADGSESGFFESRSSQPVSYGENVYDDSDYVVSNGFEDSAVASQNPLSGDLPHGIPHDMPKDTPKDMSQEYASLMEDDGYWGQLADSTPDKPLGYYADMSVLAPSDAEDTGPLHGIPVVKLDEFEEED